LMLNDTSKKKAETSEGWSNQTPFSSDHFVL